MRRLPRSKETLAAPVEDDPLDSVIAMRLEFSAALSRETLACSSPASRNCCSY
jgi:hypothetical protein